MGRRLEQLLPIDGRVSKHEVHPFGYVVGVGPDGPRRGDRVGYLFRDHRDRAVNINMRRRAVLIAARRAVGCKRVLHSQRANSRSAANRSHGIPLTFSIT